MASLPLMAAQAAIPTYSEQPTTLPTAVPVGYAPDRCEPNDSLIQPCALPTEIETTDLTFVDDALDVYSVLLKANRSYTIRAHSVTGIDPLLTVFLAGSTEQPIAQNDDLAVGSGDSAVQITTTADGWYLIQIENQAPGDMRGRTYSLSIRSSVPLTGSDGGTSSTVAPQPIPPGDAFENNWRVEDAPRLAWDVPYDLSLVCPELRPGACPSGDHDFFLVPIKAGMPFVALTYDLGPGADTTLALYRPTPGATDSSTGIVGWQLVQGNDDAVRGRILRSQVILTPNWNGEALLIVAASDRANPPRVPDALGPSGRYRLMVGSPFLPGMAQALAAQQESSRNVAGTGASSAERGVNAAPTPSAPVLGPTILPTPAPAAGDAEEIIREECLTGLARVMNPAGARFSAAAVPGKDSRILMIYPQESEVTLLGSCYLGWVKVRPTTAVSPGWMYAPDLELLEVTGDFTQAMPSATPDPLFPDASDQVGASSPPNNQAAPAHTIQVVPLPSRTAAPTTSLPRQAISLAVQVLDGQRHPYVGLRVQLVDVLGSVLREGQTDAQGRITLVADLPASAAVWAQLPAAGLTAPVDRSKPELVFVVPRSDK